MVTIDNRHACSDRRWVDDPLWHALAAMRIEPEGASLTFTKRLARENGWPRSFAAAVVTEYRRFLYLAATGAATVTPSQQIDQAWHLHLAYTRHYWGELCAQIIGRPLHHGPTAGGGAEGRKFRNCYAETLARYRATFGEEPPTEIWPPTEQRFAVNYQWVDRSANFVLPRRSVSVVALAGGATLLAACTALAADTVDAGTPSGFKRLLANVLGSDFGFVAFVALLFVVLIVVATMINRLRGGASDREHTLARKRSVRQQQTDSSSGSGITLDSWSGGNPASGATAAGGAAYIAGGGDFGGSGADGDWETSNDSSRDSGGDSGCSSGCGGGCGGD
ncbi:hypothetical protein GCM10010833_13010 [Blastomonas aquatica]|uniref:TIGR04222 domain-containing membrane protein n=1 Tax=Blastomonas aquatica TaxID=1510276 RepID=A0ABQ1J645_9SPHN|nr:hypothetical protein [Blastomonas aquatica]GGB59564.1 hypothetical protein GCM10010833_13010 [Blastomonas aquatica]